MFGKTYPIPNGYDASLPDNAAYGSKVINGQLTSVYTARALFPSQAPAPYYAGNGAKPPTLAGYSPVGMSSSGRSYPTTGIGGGMVASGYSMSGGAWDLRNSPAPWAIAFLVIGFVGLRQIHWRPE